MRSNTPIVLSALFLTAALALPLAGAQSVPSLPSCTAASAAPQAPCNDAEAFASGAVQTANATVVSLGAPCTPGANGVPPTIDISCVGGTGALGIISGGVGAFLNSTVHQSPDFTGLSNARDAALGIPGTALGAITVIATGSSGLIVTEGLLFGDANTIAQTQASSVNAIGLGAVDFGSASALATKAAANTTANSGYLLASSVYDGETTFANTTFTAISGPLGTIGTGDASHVCTDGKAIAPTLPQDPCASVPSSGQVPRELPASAPAFSTVPNPTSLLP
ncbi:MAG: hypothetical protein ACYDCK_11545 [Thermoplasmatota archaeon]